MSSARVKLDNNRFDPWTISALTHELSDHPLLQMDALIQLGQRLEARGLVRTHSDQATAATSFADAPMLLPNSKGAKATLSNMATAHAWMSLLNVQADPLYRRFIDELLDEVRPVIDRRDLGMCYRAGWIFVTSPNAVTPFHIDHEHNIILQIRGNKRLHAWDPLDRDVVSELAQERFHTEHSRELVTYDESFDAKAQVFELEPGMGGYMPSTSPHVVTNSDNVSVTMSLTFYTDSTRRRALLYRGNAMLRRAGVKPAPVGASTLRDQAKVSALSAVLEAKHRLRAALGKGITDTSVRYAPA